MSVNRLHIPRTWLVRGQNIFTRSRFNGLHEENSGTQKALLVMLAYTSKQNSFHSRTHRVTTFGVPYGMNMPHVFLHVSTYGRFHPTKKEPVRNFGNSSCPMEHTFRLNRPDPSNRDIRHGYCYCKKDTKERYWGQQFCQFGPTD